MKILSALVAAALFALPLRAEEITVFAASSLKTALDQVAADWQSETGNLARLSYDGSAKLAKQIGAGAPADLFISAAPEWMDVVQEAGLIDAATRRDILGNRLVLVSHGTGTPVEISPALDLKSMLAGGKLAMGMVTSVPAGQYGKEALESLGLWAKVQADVAEAENARAALKMVALDEAPLGIVFASDAVAEPGVTVLGTFPDDSHAPILYPAAVTAGAGAAARGFLDYLSSDSARARFAAQGFIVK